MQVNASPGEQCNRLALAENLTMQMPIDIDFRNLPPSAALSAAIRKRAAKLATFWDGIIGCHVTLESPHHHHHQGMRYDVRIRVTVPGSQIVVSHQPAVEEHEDALKAIHDAFDAAQRQLQDHRQLQRGDVKRHSAPSPESNGVLP